MAEATPTFNASAVWADAVRLLKASAGLQIVLAGLFLFLPQAIALFLSPEMLTEPAPMPFAEPDGENTLPPPSIARVLTSAVLGLLQLFGLLAMTAVLDRRRRPTVAHAMRIAGAGLLPMVGTVLIIVVAVLLIGLPLLMLAAAGGGVLSTIVIAVLAIAALFLAARLSVIVPLIAFESIRSPRAVIARSWELTGPAAGKIVTFYLLLMVAGLVLGIVLSLVTGSLVLLSGGTGIVFAMVVLLQSAISAALNAVLVAIGAAIYYHLAGSSAPGVADTFA